MEGGAVSEQWMVDGGSGEGLADGKRRRGEHGERRAQGEGERSGKEKMGGNKGFV